MKKEENKKEEKKESKTGRYVYDKKLGKVVKISDDIVGLKKGESSSSGFSCPSGGCCPGCQG